MSNPIQTFVWGRGNTSGIIIPPEFRLITITFNNVYNKRSFFTDVYMQENTLEYRIFGSSYTNAYVAEKKYPINFKEGGNHMSFEYIVPVNGNAGGDDAVNRQITTILLGFKVKSGLTLPVIETLSIGDKLLRTPSIKAVNYYTNAIQIRIHDDNGLFFSDNTPVTFLNCKYNLKINFRDIG